MRNKLWIGIALMVLSAALTASGQAFWKVSGQGLLHQLSAWQLYVGFLCYGMGAVLMTLAFRFGSLSVLHPILTIGYVFSVFIGVFALHESITIHGLLGDAAIIIGAVFLGISERHQEESTGLEGSLQ